jgi:hypothetical protein
LIAYCGIEPKSAFGYYKYYLVDYYSIGYRVQLLAAHDKLFQVTPPCYNRRYYKEREED